MSVNSVIEELRTGKRTVWSLDSSLFEQVVFRCIVAMFGGDRSTQATFERWTRGPIDIVVAIPDPLLGTEDEYFIECKYYRTRKLDLDHSAKAFCAAIRYQPKLLAIVSPAPLTPQASEYASHFFGPTGRYRTRFRHLSFERLLSSAGGFAPTESETSDDPASKRPVFRHWALQSQSVFSGQIEASSTDTHRTVQLQSKRSYSLKIWLSTALGTSSPELLDDQGRAVPEVDLAPPGDLPGGGQLLTFRLAVGRFRPSLVVKGVRASGPSGERRLEFPSLQLVQTALRRPELEDLRPQESRELVDRLCGTEPANIIFVRGEGGIGKTFLCERACRALTAMGYRAHRLHASFESSASILVRLAWPVLAPSREYEHGDGDLERELLFACVGRALRETKAPNPERLEEHFRAMRFSSIDVDVLADVVATVLIRAPTPQVLLLTNCHEIGPQALAAVRLLVLALHDRGWGRTRILFEFRDGPEDRSPEWESFARATRSQLHGSAREVSVRPVDQNTVVEGVAGLFGRLDRRDLARALWTRTGGHPLHLVQLLHHFIDRGYVGSPEGGESPLEIRDHVGLFRDLEEGSSEMAVLLQRRIEFALDAPGAFPGAECTGLVAAGSHLTGPIDPDRMAGLIGTSADSVKRSCNALVDANILRPIDDAEGRGFAFVHDLMRLAARRTSVQRADTRQRLRNIERSWSPTTHDDMLFLGETALSLGMRERALDRFNAAYELTRHGASYPDQHRSLRGCRRAQLGQLARDETDARRRIAVVGRLGQVELQLGSRIDAEEALQSVLEESEAAVAGGFLGARDVADDVLQAFLSRMTIQHRALDPKRGLDLADAALDACLTAEHIAGLAGRLNIVCYNSCFREQAVRTARIALCAESDVTGDGAASQLSNLGNVFLHSDPARTERIWVRAVELAASPRERSHARLNLFVAALFGGQASLRPEEAERELLRLTGLGALNQYLRFSLLLAVGALMEGRIDEARPLLRRGLVSSRAGNLRFLSWQILSNLALCDLFDDDLAAARRHLTAAFEIVLPTVRFATERADEVKATCDRLEGCARALGVGDEASGFEELLGDDIPRATGTVLVLLENLRRIHARRLLPDVPEPPQHARSLLAEARQVLDDHPLNVETPAGKLLLAIE